MVEYEVYVDVLDKQFSIDVDFGDTFKSAKNRYFPSLSPCCKTKLVQEKKCSSCSTLVANGDVKDQQVKIGKKSWNVPKAQLKAIQDNLSATGTDIKIKSVVKEIPIERVDGARFCKPAKKRVRDYIELREYCKEHTLIGEAVIKSNSYEVGLTTRGNVLILVKFAQEDRMREKPNLEGTEGIEINSAVVSTAREVFDEVEKDGHDFTQFEDKRASDEEELIMKVVEGEELPDVDEKTESETARPIVDDASEVERLKEKLKAMREKRETGVA